MTDALPGKGDFRERMRTLMRASILDSARTRAASTDWNSVRMADIADDVGVSRQTVYNEFGGKDDLAQALFLAEVDELTQRILEHTRGARGFPGALTKVLREILDAASGHEIVRRMVEDARDGTAVSILPMLTWSSESLLVPARGFFFDTFTARWPVDDPVLAEQTVDQLVRMVISEILMPSERPRDEVIHHMVMMAVAVLDPQSRQAAGLQSSSRVGR